MVLGWSLVLSCRELRLAGCPPLTLLACPIFLFLPQLPTLLTNSNADNESG